MNCQMIRVISSPSSSTTGFSTLIFAMTLPRAQEPGRSNRGEHLSGIVLTPPCTGGKRGGCVVPESRGALSRDEEDALWQVFYTAAPAQRRAFEPSSKRRKRRPASSPPATG